MVEARGATIEHFGVSAVLEMVLRSRAAACEAANGFEMHRGGGVLLLMSGGGDVIVCRVDLMEAPLGKQLPVTVVGVVGVWAKVVMKFGGIVVLFVVVAK